MRLYRGDDYPRKARTGVRRTLLCLLLSSFVSGCGDDGSARRVTLRVASKPVIGSYLTDGDGRAVYAFTGDALGQSACLTNCATVWPPVITGEAALPGDAAIDSARLTLLLRPDSSSQVVYDGSPLYYYGADAKDGDTSGHGARGFGGLFSLVTPAGKPIIGTR
jgi:predicted lipoprotein with Yx(FWY)xxD motif